LLRTILQSVEPGRREARRHFRNKLREYLEDKINEIERNSKNKNIRDLHGDIKEFKTDYQPITNLLKDERGDQLADPHIILSSWTNYFCQGVNGSGGVRQTEKHAAEPFVPESRALEVEVAISK
jgi:hypothetical protein